MSEWPYLDRVSEAIGRGENFGDIKPGIHEGYISEIYSPTRFYFQLQEDVEPEKSNWEYKQKVWNDYYDNKDPIHLEKYELEATDIEEGNMIFAFALGLWDRAIILSKKLTKDDTIKVFFFDYGTVGNVEKKNCRKMKHENWKDIKKLTPFLARRGILLGVQPIGGKTLWPMQTTFDFIEKVKDKKIEIDIVKYHEETKTYGVKLLIDKKDLSDEMIDNMVAEKSIAGSKCFTYPSFECLESDFYPTLGERDFLLRKRRIIFDNFEEKFIDHDITQRDLLSAEMNKKLQIHNADYWIRGYSFLKQGIV